MPRLLSRIGRFNLFRSDSCWFGRILVGSAFGRFILLFIGIYLGFSFGRYILSIGICFHSLGLSLVLLLVDSFSRRDLVWLGSFHSHSLCPNLFGFLVHSISGRIWLGCSFSFTFQPTCWKESVRGLTDAESIANQSVMLCVEFVFWVYQYRQSNVICYWYFVTVAISTCTLVVVINDFRATCFVASRRVHSIC